MNKTIPLLIVAMTFFICCSENNERFDPERADTIYSERSFTIDSASTIFASFHKQGAVKGRYSHRMDWCGARKKVYSLYDKNNCNIFTLAIDELCFTATKTEFDNNGKQTKVYKLIRRGERCFDNADRFYNSDSLFLNTIIPLTESKWMAFHDSLRQF